MLIHQLNNDTLGTTLTPPLEPDVSYTLRMAWKKTIQRERPLELKLFGKHAMIHVLSFCVAFPGCRFRTLGKCSSSGQAIVVVGTTFTASFNTFTITFPTTIFVLSFVTGTMVQTNALHIDIESVHGVTLQYSLTVSGVSTTESPDLSTMFLMF